MSLKQCSIHNPKGPDYPCPDYPEKCLDCPIGQFFAKVKSEKQ